MTIAEVSKKYDLTPDTLRYYEKIGLISNVPRTKSGIRNYDDKTCNQIEFIKCMRNAGVEIERKTEVPYSNDYDTVVNKEQEIDNWINIL